MARDTRKRFNAEVAKLTPRLREAFLQAIANIRDQVSIREITRLLEAGDIAGAVDAFGFIDRQFVALTREVAATYQAGGDYQVSALPKKNPATGSRLVMMFDVRHPRAEKWIAEKSSKLIVQITDGQKAAVRDQLTLGLSEGRNPRNVALDVVGRVSNRTGKRTGGMIGLTDREMSYVDNYREKLLSEGRKPAQVERMTTKYSNKKLRQRGERIARTEAITALNGGRLEGVKQAVDNGLVKKDQVMKVWGSTGDGRVRDSHSEMDGQKRPLDEPFTTPTGYQMDHPGDSSLGAPASETVNERCYMRIDIDFMADLR